MPGACNVERPMLTVRINVLMFVITAVIGVPALTFGQWLHYPTPDVPRTADGKPNLTAPAPRLPDGKPDFSGIWHAANRNPCTPEASRFIPCGVEIGGSPLARDLGRNLPGGLPYQPWAAALVKQRTADDSRDDPHVRCLPDNPPRPWGLPHLTKAVHTPKLLVLLYERDVPADLHRWTAAAVRSHTRLERVLHRHVGG